MPLRLNVNHEFFRRTRREKGITQAELARLAGCTQSAVSMFEAGRRDAVNDATIQTIASVLDIDLKGPDATGAEAAAAAFVAKYCPIDDCPSNFPYLVRNRVLLMPGIVNSAVQEKTRCRLCGELLESTCSNGDCMAPVTRGACCHLCGTPYVSFIGELNESPELFVSRRQTEVRNLRESMQNQSRHGFIGSAGSCDSDGGSRNGC
ncbi:MAG: helix-turn-helix transcriptional regulator [Kiritimatiellia bacterium]|nr:helix-turn-helix transcriptional regulator [Kiritimatiellia bacterium]